MELPKLGKQCNDSNCNQLDFLPLVCQCTRRFCSEHFNIHVQECITANKQESVVELKKIENVFTCSNSDCHETSIVPLVCKKCGKHFCIRHRHVECYSDADRVSQALLKQKFVTQDKLASETKVVIDEQIQDRIAKAKSKEKTRKMASKIQLMRIKNKATGLKTIPTEDRLYFNIHVKKSDEKIVPVFVAATWSLGRAIDAIAVECNLTNNNNRANEKKLRLFKKDDCNIVSDNMAVGLSCLLENDSLTNGEDLIIEYVEDLCIL